MPNYLPPDEKEKFLGSFWRAILGLADSKQNIINPLMKDNLLPINGTEQPVSFRPVAQLDRLVILEPNSGITFSLYYFDSVISYLLF